MKRYIGKPGRIWRTLRPMSARQIAAQVAHRVFAPIRPTLGKWIPEPAVADADGSSAQTPLPRTLRDAFRRAYQGHPQTLQAARDMGSGCPSFLGKREEGSLESVSWQSIKHGRLWQFHLHYLDALPYLAASESPEDDASALALLDAWERANPQGSDPGWGPYPLAKRIENYARVLVLKDPSHPLSSRCRARLFHELPWLYYSQERHIRANHLLSNFTALAWGLALFPSWPFVAKRRGKIEREFLAELREQFLSDGGHYERSPGYHNQLLREVLELSLLEGSTPVFSPELSHMLHSVSQHGQEFRQAMTHPDGAPSFFHDSNAEVPAFHFPENGELEPGEYLFSPSGFSVWQTPPWYLVAFSGHSGPAYQPGHVHCDALSFEASYGGERIFVNSGVAGYAEAEDRHFMRSTQAHNTVSIPGAEQYEIWASFRVGARGTPGGLRQESTEHKRILTGSFQWPEPGKPVHRRTWSLEQATGILHVMDRVEGAGSTDFSARYHLHPACEYSPDTQIISSPKSTFKVEFVEAEGQCESSYWMPAFGVRSRNTVLVLRPKTDTAFGLRVTPLQP